MKALLLSLFCFIVILNTYGQVSGVLTGGDGKPVDFASVALISNTDSVVVRSVITDHKGAFSITEVPDGIYMLKITSVGYINWFSNPFTLNAAQHSYDAGTIVLKAASTQLGEVVIRSDKPVVQHADGGLAVNVQNSLMTKGSSVLQVLQRAPGVTIDPQSSNISLNGKSGVMVMLDGKLMRLSATQVAALLDGMPADDIEKIELLTTPPAKYDADGDAGLINIVRKKSRKAGTNGTVTASAGYGKGEKASADVRLNHNGGNLSLYGSYSYNHNRSYGLLLAQGTEDVGVIGGQTAFHYNGESKPVADYHGFNGGLDYRASTKTTLGGNVYYSIGTNLGNNNNFGNYIRPDSTLVYDSHITSTSNSYFLQPGIYLTEAFSQDQKLNVDLDYFAENNNSPTQVQSNFSDSLFAPRQRNLSNTAIKVGVAKMDYSGQVNKKLKLESGLKGTYTVTQSSSGIQNYDNGQWVAVGAGTSNDLGTREVIGAAYTTMDWQPDSLNNLSGGARYEYSHNSTDHSLNAQYAVDRRLGKLFPSVFYTRKLSATDQLQLSYTERISRPTFADLASYVSYNDPVSVFTGNPALKPTITHNLKLAYGMQDCQFSLLYSRDVDPILGIQVMTGPTKGLVYLLPENADWQNNLTLQAVVPIRPATWWDMNYTFTGGWHEYLISYFAAPLDKGYLSYSLNFTESFRPAKSYSIELSGYYNSPFYSGNSRSNGNAIVNLGFKKDLPNNGGSLQLSVNDIFRAANYYSRLGVLTTDAFNSNVTVHYQAESHSFPIVKLSYSRLFGSNAKKVSHDNNATREEQNRL